MYFSRCCIRRLSISIYPKRDPLFRITGYSQGMLSLRQFEQAGRSAEHLIFFFRHPMQATTSFFLSFSNFFSFSELALLTFGWSAFVLDSSGSTFVAKLPSLTTDFCVTLASDSTIVVQLQGLAKKMKMISLVTDLNYCKPFQRSVMKEYNSSLKSWSRNESSPQYLGISFNSNGLVIVDQDSEDGRNMTTNIYYKWYTFQYIW